MSWAMRNKPCSAAVKLHAHSPEVIRQPPAQVGKHVLGKRLPTIV